MAFWSSAFVAFSPEPAAPLAAELLLQLPNTPAAVDNVDDVNSTAGADTAAASVGDGHDELLVAAVETAVVDVAGCEVVAYCTAFLSL